MRRLLTRGGWPLAPQVAMTAVLALLVVALVLGDANPEVNSGMYLLWGLWWPLVPLSFVALGRLWCAVCPVSLAGDLAARGNPRRPAAPAILAGRGAALLVVSFAAVHVANLWFRFEEDRRATAWLLAALGVGAVVLTLAFRDRGWCTALCPLGALGRFLARLSPLRIAGGAAPCTQECAAQACSRGDRGGPALCPVGIDLRAGIDPGACILCGNCLKACTRLGEARWTAGARDLASLSAAEPLAVLAFLGLGLDMALTHLVDWPILFWQLTAALAIDAGPWTETALHAGVIAAPPVLALALLSAPGSGRRPPGGLAALAAAALPVAGAGLLAVTLRPLLVEGPLRLQRLLLDVGLEGAMAISAVLRLDGLPMAALQETVVAAGIAVALPTAMRRQGPADSPAVGGAGGAGGRLRRVAFVGLAGAAFLWICARPMTG